MSSVEVKERVELVLAEWQANVLKDTTSDVMCVSAGFGTGKTFIDCLFAYDRIKMNPRSDVLFVEPKWQLIKSVAMVGFEDLFQRLGLSSGYHYKIIASSDSPRVQFNTGQNIYFASGEKPKTIVGYSRVATTIIDEAALQSLEVYQKGTARARHSEAVKCQTLITSTPEGLNWVADTFDSDAQPGWTKETPFSFTKEVEVSLGSRIVKQQIKRIRATTFDNEHNLDPSYIPNLIRTYGHNQNYIDSYVYGYFRPFAEGLAYSCYKPQVHRIADIDPDPHKDLHLTWDFNICPQWSSIQEQRDWIYTGGQSLVYDAIIHNSNAGHEQLEDACIEFALKHPRAQFADTPIYLWGDSSGNARSHKVKGSDYDNIKRILKKLGYRRVAILAIKSNPLERTSIDLVNTRFFNDTLKVCERCDKIQMSLARTTWADGKKAKLAKPEGDTWTHPMDGVKYYVFGKHEQGRRRILGAG